MRIIRKELATAQVYPDNLRYDETNDVVQYSPDGGTTWIDDPGSDPRLHNAYPPPDTDDPRCDAAARMTGLLIDYEQQLEDLAQAGAATAEIATAILLFLAFIPLIGVLTAVFVGISLQVVTVGYAALHAAFLGFDWSAIQCQLYQQVDNLGNITDGGYEAFYAWMESNYTGTVLSFLELMLSSLGRAGLNDAAATRGETGDCSSICSGYCYEWDFENGESHWVGFISSGVTRAVYDSARWVGTVYSTSGSTPSLCGIIQASTWIPTAITGGFEIEYDASAGFNMRVFGYCPGGLELSPAGGVAMPAGSGLVAVRTGTFTTCKIRLSMQTPNGVVASLAIRKVRQYGPGAIPGFSGGTQIY